MSESRPSPPRGTLAELAPYLAEMRPHLLLLATGLALNLVAVASSIGLIALSGWFLSASAFAGLSVATATVFNYMLPSAGVRLFATTRTLGRYGERVATHEGTLRLLSRLRRKVYLAIEPLSPAALQRIGSSELSTRLTADVDALDALYVRVLVPSLVAALAIVGCAVLVGVFAPMIGVFVAVALSISALLGPWLAWRRGSRHADRWQRLDTSLRARLLERLETFAELSLYGRWGAERDELLSRQRERDDEQLTLARRWGDSQLLSQLLLGLSVTGALALAAWWSIHHGLNASLVALIGLGVLAAFEALMMLPQAWQELGKVNRAARRLNQLSESVPTIRFPDHDLAEPSDQRLSLRGVELAYDGHPVLRGVDLELAVGEHLALIGPSGGGKTTLFNLLTRFIDPDAGSLRIGGVPLASLSEASLRKRFAVALQEVQIFSATYRDNLRLGARDIDDRSLIEMLEALGLGGWLRDQPEGLDSWPDEGGSSLSGGQLRRFGLARALLSKAPIVLLDEPTEGLDRVTQAQVMAHVHACCRNRSLIAITHRLQDLDAFDRCVIVDQGRIIEAGAPRALALDPDSRLSALYRELRL